MVPSQRTVLTGLVGVGLVPIVPGRLRAATSAERVFEVLRGGRDIGRHVVRIERDGGDVAVAVDIDFVVRLLGIPAYRYEMRNREVWRGGTLVSVDSETNNDGTRQYVRVRRENGGLAIDGSDHSGMAPLDAATTTYFVPDFLQRDPWIGTDGGALLDIATERLGQDTVETGAGPVICARHRVTDGEGFTTDLFYDDRGEWLSCRFDAGGTEAVYRPREIEAEFRPIWQEA